MAEDPPLFQRLESEFSVTDSGYSSPDSFSPTRALVLQYLEALYSTNVSLAYFAKSALSRARAEFQQSELCPDESLNSVLEGMILKMEEFNSKYEDFIPNLVRGGESVSNCVISDEERKYILQKFNRGRGDEQTSLQKEINNLKNREYPHLP